MGPGVRCRILPSRECRPFQSGMSRSSSSIVHRLSLNQEQVQYIGGPIYCLAVLGFKVSLLGGYLRVAGFNKTYAIVLYVVLGLVTVSQLIFTFLLSFACTPVEKQWDPSVPGTCINTLPTYFALGGTSLAWDVLIIVLPFPILRRLQLDKRNKVRKISFRCSPLLSSKYVF